MGRVMHQLANASGLGMMLMPVPSIGSSPIATHRTHYLGPFGQRAGIALPSHCQLVAGFFIQAADNQFQMPVAIVSDGLSHYTNSTR